MKPTQLTPEAKDTLRKTVRGLRERLITQLTEAAKGEYRLDVAIEKAKLPEARHERRRRLQGWIDAQAQTAKGPDGRGRFLQQAVKEAAHTLLNRLVLVRMLEHHEVLAPAVVTGGWKSPAYAHELVGYAGPLGHDETLGYRALLGVVFAELEIELPGLFGPVGLTPLFPVPAGTLREVVEALNDPALASAWGDDTTLGWVYQYWNDPEREALDAKIAGGGKIAPHEIASKTQMFTERYMVEWLLQNSLGLTWLAICRKNGWKADAEGVLPILDARRAAWRDKREKGEVALDALMPIEGALESAWKYYVPQPIPEEAEATDAGARAPGSIRDVKLLDPACGSGHFLVIAFGLLASMYAEEARHRGEAWTDEAIAESILANNLHGIDIDPRAIQIAAAGLWLRAKLHAPAARLGRMNLVAPAFRLGALPKDDPGLAQLFKELAALGVPRATTEKLVASLSGVDHLGTLLRVDDELAKAIDASVDNTGPLFKGVAEKQRTAIEARVAAFLDAHAAEADLGLRLEGEQLAAGLRFVQMVKEGSYDVVVGNPPYQGLSKTAQFEYVVKNYPTGKADLYAAFLVRGLELVREGGLSALLTMRGWMFLGQFTDLRAAILGNFDLRSIGDFDRGAFDEVANEVLAVAAPIVRRAGPTGVVSVAVQPTPIDDNSYDRQRTHRKRAAVLSQVGRHEFDPKSFAVIEGEPLVYWWTKDFLTRYAKYAKFGQLHPGRQGLGTRNDVRFLRQWWEVAEERLFVPRTDHPELPQTAAWVPYIKGAAGQRWLEPLEFVINWGSRALQLHVWIECYRLRAPGQYIKNDAFYFRRGVAFTTIGSSFGARAHRFPSVFGEAGSSVFTDDIPSVTCAMNGARARFVLESLNPTINFKTQDVNRLPAYPIRGAKVIFARAEAAFSDHEGAREASFEFVRPASCAWRYAQDWAQRAVDRADDAPMPAYKPDPDPPVLEAYVSFAFGVALGRFASAGARILNSAPETALPAGILFVGPTDALPDSLRHPAFAPVHAAWVEHSAAILEGKKLSLRDWLRKEFFAYHKALYENRPIYFPLSSDKRSFVAWVSIHRWTDQTLPTLLVDHLRPVLQQLDGEITDLNHARATSDKKSAIAAEKQYTTAKRLRDELADFVAAITVCAERGAPPTDAACPPREVDATFHMDLDDGVMINSAALWPLLAPQWSDPKKWWKQLCLAEGKDYDWAHLAQRYFPTRVAAKCQEDPSLAVAHGCFWRLHPSKAYAWELRLQDEIRPDFTLDEADSDDARAAFLRDHAADAAALHAKEIVRRQRKAAKASAADADADADGDADPTSGTSAAGESAADEDVA